MNCSGLSFTRFFTHVKARQDEVEEWTALTRQSQLNCGCDARAKKKLLFSDPPDSVRQQPCPLEPMTLFVGDEKITSQTGSLIRFMTHRQEARVLFMLKAFFPPTNSTKWHGKLYTGPFTRPKLKMFKMFACKQVFDAFTGFNNLCKQEKYRHIGKTCPCCTICVETCGRILLCSESSRVTNLSVKKMYCHHGYPTQVLTKTWGC